MAGAREGDGKEICERFESMCRAFLKLPEDGNLKYSNDPNRHQLYEV